MERCRGLGIEVSILATLMTANYDRMGELVALARLVGVNLRVNAYQPVRSERFRLTYAQFWQGYRDLFAAGLVVSCTEPVVRAAMGLGDVESPCALAQHPLQSTWPDHPVRLLADGWLRRATHRRPGRYGRSGYGGRRLSRCARRSVRCSKLPVPGRVRQPPRPSATSMPTTTIARRCAASRPCSTGGPLPPKTSCAAVTSAPPSSSETRFTT